MEVCAAMHFPSAWIQHVISAGLLPLSAELRAGAGHHCSRWVSGPLLLLAKAIWGGLTKSSLEGTDLIDTWFGCI